MEKLRSIALLICGFIALEALSVLAGIGLGTVVASLH